MTRRERYAQGAARIGLPSVLDRAQGPRRLTVLAYHRIGRDPQGRDEPWDPDLISATPEEFGRQLDVLRRCFTVISLDDLAAFVEGRGQLPPRAALVTFDDGYRDNHALALPELRSRSLPAVVFLVSGAMDTAKPMWWDVVAYAIANAPYGDLELPVVGRTSLTSDAERTNARRQLGAGLKRMPVPERDATIEALLASLDLEPPATGPPFMTWDEARECQLAGFDCQAHTVTHPILTRTTPSAAREEIRISVADVASQTGARQVAFAYPNGGPADVDPSLAPVLSASGVVMAFMLDGGPAPYSQVEADPFRIARIPIYSGDSGDVFRLKVMGAARIVERARALSSPGKRPGRTTVSAAIGEDPAPLGRAARERRFWDTAHGSDTRARQAKYYAVTSERVARYRALVCMEGAHRDCLEIGCAAGGLSIELAQRGGRVVGVDVSPVAIAEARQAAVAAGLDDRARFEVMDASALEFADATFDLVFASGVIHHLPLDPCLSEIARVLRPGGAVVVTEPLSGNPIIGAYRRLTPAARSPDERPLSQDDLALFGDHFDDVDISWYHGLSLVAVPLRGTRSFPRVLRALDAADAAIFRAAPLARRCAWYALLVARRPLVVPSDSTS